METKTPILAKDVVLPQKETIEVFNLGTKEAPRYIVTENTVRRELSTHEECSSCGNIIEKNRYCDFCQSKKESESYFKKPFREWDGETPVCIHNSDQYFWGSDEIDDYLEENEIDVSELKLVICTPNHVSQVDEDYWADEMPENYDSLSDFNKEFVQKLKEFNDYISTLKPLSWSQGIYRTEYTRD